METETEREMGTVAGIPQDKYLSVPQFYFHEYDLTPNPRNHCQTVDYSSML